MRRVLCFVLIAYFASGYRGGFGSGGPSAFGPYGSGNGPRGPGGRGVFRPWEGNNGRHVNVESLPTGVNKAPRAPGRGQGQGVGDRGVKRPKPVNPEKPWEAGLSKGVV